MQKWIKTNIASNLQFLKPVQSVVLSGYIRRCRTADAVYMVNEEGVAQQELRGAEAVIGLQLGIFTFEDGEGVIALVEQCHQAVGRPADENPVSSLQFLGSDARGTEKTGLEGRRMLEFFPPGVEGRLADESAQDIQRSHPRRRFQAYIAPQPLESGRGDVLVDFPLYNHRQRLKVRGGMHLPAIFAFHFLEQERYFRNLVGHG